MTLLQKIKSNKPLVNVLVLALGLLLMLAGFKSNEIKNVLGYIETHDPAYFQVVEVHDGDTISVDIHGTTERVRLIGVDTPEKDHPERPVQCFSHAATEFLTQLLKDKRVRLEADPTNSNRDRYDRLLRYVYLEDNTLVNAEIVKQGYGFAYLSFPFTRMDEFQSLEEYAELNNLGLWGSCDVELNDGYINTNPA